MKDRICPDQDCGHPVLIQITPRQAVWGLSVQFICGSCGWESEKFDFSSFILTDDAINLADNRVNW